MIYKMDLKDSSDTMTFNLLETPIVDKDIEGAVDNVTLDGNQYTDYLYLKKQYIQKWAIMCPDEYDELRGFYTRQFEEGEVPSYRVYYGANVTRDYTLNGDYFQFNAEGIETGMTLSQLLGNAEQTTYSGKNLLNIDFTSTTTTGITVTNNGDGTVTVSGTTTGAIGVNLSPSATNQQNPLTLAPNTAYTQRLEILSGSASNFNIVPAFKDSGGTVHYNFFRDNQTVTTTGTMTCSYYNIYCSAAGRVINATFRVWLEKGSDLASPYEPYVGGIPAPNPSYPQPISTVTGEQKVKIIGKNLWDNFEPSTKSASITWTPTDNGGTFINTGTWSTGLVWDYTLDTTQQYTVQLSTPSDRPLYFYARSYTDGTYTTESTRYVHEGRGNISRTFQPDTPYVRLFFWNGQAINDGVSVQNMMFELGSTATTYEPYQGQSYEVNLGKNLFSISQDTIITNAYLNNNTTLTFDNLNSVKFVATGTQGAQYLYRIISGLDRTKSYTFSFKAIKNVKGSTGLPYIRITTSGSNDGSTWTGLGFSGNDNPTEGETYSFAKTLTGYSQYRFMIFNNADTPVQIGETTTFFDMQLEEGAQTAYAPYSAPIELAKIGDYQDRIYKDDGKWYIEKQVGKVDLGTLTWTGTPLHSTTSITDIKYTSTNTELGAILAEKYTPHIGSGMSSATGCIAVDVNAVRVNDTNTPSGLAYYALATPTTTEITDETLLLQLNFLASLYGGENNISLVGTGAQGEMEVFIRDVMSVETDVVPEVPVRLTLTDDGVINACGCRRNVQLTMRETTE